MLEAERDVLKVEVSKLRRQSEAENMKDIDRRNSIDFCIAPWEYTHWVLT